MLAKALRYLGGVLGFSAFIFILATADYSEIYSNLEIPGFLLVLSVSIIGLLISSVSFASIASQEFSSSGTFRDFFRKSLSATLSNAGMPLSGTVSKVSELSLKGIKVRHSLRVLVNVSMVRAFASASLAIITAPLIPEIKVIFVLLLLMVFILWTKGWGTRRPPSAIDVFTPARSLRYLRHASKIFLVELALVFFSATGLFAVWSLLYPEASFSTSVFAAAMATLVTLIPVSPGGIGTRDSAILLVLAGWGLDSALSASIALVVRLISLIALFAVGFSLLIAKRLNQ